MELFDESIFDDGKILNGFEIVSVSNKADKFLVEKLGKTATSQCNELSDVAVNPPFKCRNFNIHTMKCKLMPWNIGFTRKFCKINVSPLNATAKEHIHILRIEEPIENVTVEQNGALPASAEFVVYDLNVELTPLEAAIMLKYNAFVRENVNVTIALYLYVYAEFEDPREWFNIPGDSSKYMLKNKNLIQNNQILFTEYSLYSPMVEF